jgi:cytochrome c oxidase subunit 1
MATEALALTRSDGEASPIVDRLHQWVTTVDHKRLGVMYVAYAVVFLAIGGIEAIRLSSLLKCSTGCSRCMARR